MKTTEQLICEAIENDLGFVYNISLDMKRDNPISIEKLQLSRRSGGLLEFETKRGWFGYCREEELNKLENSFNGHFGWHILTDDESKVPELKQFLADAAILRLEKDFEKARNTFDEGVDKIQSSLQAED